MKTTLPSNISNYLTMYCTSTLKIWQIYISRPRHGGWCSEKRPQGIFFLFLFFFSFYFILTNSQQSKCAVTNSVSDFIQGWKNTTFEIVICCVRSKNRYFSNTLYKMHRNWNCHHLIVQTNFCFDKYCSAANSNANPCRKQYTRTWIHSLKKN